MQNIELNIVNKLGSLDRWTQSIEATVYSSLEEIEKHLTIDELSIAVFDKPQWAIPETGIGGFATNGYHIDIYLDSQYPELGRSIQYQLPRTLAHEIHHALRTRRPGYGQTLFEALVSEGLADHFDCEVWQQPSQPWTQALNIADQQTMLERAKTEYLNQFYSESDWFFGSKAKGIPRWTGYTLGWLIVSYFLEQQPHQTAATLVHAPAHLFTKDLAKLSWMTQ